VELYDALMSQAGRLLAQVSQPEQLLALASAGVAALLVIVSTFVRTMIPLRWLAVASNIGFIIYGLAYPAPLMVALHSVLLPVNLWRVWQMIQLTQRVARSAADPRQMEIWLRPYMRSKQLKAGEQIFANGELASRMYYLASGEVRLPEVGRTLQAGAMFGEIAFFAPDRKRSSSAHCVTDCTLLSIDEDTFKQLVYQNPDFGLEVVRMIAGRLTGDIRRLQAEARARADAEAALAPAPAPAQTQAAPAGPT
jgi:CRP/FNR family transcriptional regulator, cyclic AMP receptor protein